MNVRVAEEMEEGKEVRSARRAANLTGKVTGTKDVLDTSLEALDEGEWCWPRRNRKNG